MTESFVREYEVQGLIPLQQLCTYSMNNNTSIEDKHDTNYINNKYTNTYTRKLHNL